VRGLLNLRGEVVTAIDLRTRLGLPDRDADGPAAHVIIRSDDEQVSLLVDAVEDVITLPVSALEPPPQTLIEPARTYITGVYQLEGRLLLVLDANAVVTPEVFA
jgi:purine-binding chemotaxis protein CheW